MVKKVVPHLMFKGDAEAAINLYVSLFGNSKILEIERFGADGPGEEGTVRRAAFTVGGQEMIAIDSPVPHNFSFTPSVSIFVECEDAAEQEAAFRKLAEDGQELMPLDDYGFSQRFGWVSDCFGVSWQLNLA